MPCFPLISRSSRRGFTLLEVLLVVGIIAILVGILVPVMGAAKANGYVVTCLSNLRGQALALSSYTSDYDGALPPRLIWDYSTVSGLQLNELLAIRQGDRFEEVPAMRWHVPVGIWKCPAPTNMWEKTTHNGISYYASNRWLFNSVTRFDPEEPPVISADAPAEWADRFGGSSWRMVHRVKDVANVISIMDGTSYFHTIHGFWEARESVGWGVEVINYPLSKYEGTVRASHTRTGKIPAVFVDGHAEAIGAGADYWQSGPVDFHTGGENDRVVQFEPRDVQHFLWFVRRTD